MAEEFKPLNLAQLYQGADAAVAQAMQTNLLVLQSAHMKREYDEEDQLRNLARSSTTAGPDGSPSFDLKSFTKGAYSVNPMKAIGFEKSAREAEKSALDITKTKGEIENTQEQIDERRMKSAGERLKVMNEASTVPFLKYKELIDKGVPDEEARKQVQPLHEQAMKNVIASGLFKPEQLQGMKLMQSNQFDPVVAETGMRQVLGAKDQLAQYWEERKFGQAERHHEDSMAVQLSGQDVTIRGQDLTDARAKESLAQQGLEVKENGDGTFNIVNKKTGVASDVVDKNGKPMQGKNNLTESQGKALGFGQRAVEAHNIISGLDQELGKTVALKQGAGNVPLVGGALEAAINKGVSGGAQKYEQAQRDFINAVLRPESGATITDTEFANAKKQYFPQVGDGAAVIKQKAEAREREIETLKAMAGPGAKKFPEIKKPGAGGKEGAGANDAGKPQEGATSTSKSGKPIIFRNGQWEYAS